MKTIKQLLEEARVANGDKEPEVDSYRTIAKKEEIPMMLVFKRQNIRNMNGLKIGLYYSPVLGKFITIPFGGNTEQGIGLTEGYNVDVFDLARMGASGIARAADGISSARKGIRNYIDKKVTEYELANPDFQKKTNPKEYEARVNRELKGYAAAVQKIRKAKADRKADPESFKANSKINTRYDIDKGSLQHNRVTPLSGPVSNAKASIQRLKSLGIDIPVVRKAKPTPPTVPQAKRTIQRSATSIKPPVLAGPIDENLASLWAIARKGGGQALAKLREYLAKRKSRTTAKGTEKLKKELQNLSSGTAQGDDRHVIGKSPGVRVDSAPKDSSSAETQNYIRKQQMPTAFSIQESNLQRIHRLAKFDGNTETLTFSNSTESKVIDKNQARSIAQLYESLNQKNKSKMESMIAESSESYDKILEFALRGNNG